MKKNKLYTANRWNQPIFMVDRQRNNIFDGLTFGQNSQMNIGSQPSLPSLESYLPKGLSDDTYRSLAIGSVGQMQNAFQNYGKKLVDNFGKGPITPNTSMLTKKDPFKFFNLNTTNSTKESSKTPTVTTKPSGMQAIGMGLSAVGNVPTGDKRGMWDTLDPVYHLAGGRESGAGNAMSDAGVGLTQAGLSSGNPWLALAGAGLKVVGGLTNAAFGIKTDQEKFKAANENMNMLRGFRSNAEDFDDIKDIISPMSVKNTFEGGWFSGGKAEKKQEELERQFSDAYQFAERSIDNNINNITSDRINRYLANYRAFGGPIDTINMGAINYGFMSDYLTQKKRETNVKNKMSGPAQIPAFMPNRFAIGGDLQTNGGDFSDGLTIIGAGLSHEENPNEGVQMGVDNEGTPNLVEENETIFNDYVFSNRILADEATKQMFRLPKKKEITFADISKRLEKEIAERPNDPISQAGLKSQMADLAEQQERQKQEMEAERAKAAFEALSPEEQTALMQQRAEQEALAQQQAMAEQQAAMQQPTSEEIAMVQQQQMMQADGSEAALGQEPEVAANGGRLFKDGGNTKKNAGTWKKGTSKENWDKYSRNGLRDFLMKVNDDLANANTEEEKNKIREKAIKTVRGIQQAYSEAYQNNLTPSEVNEKVTALQKAFQEAGGNAYFGDIADNINLPKGHNTADTEEKGWVDGLWGPRTSIRNWGSTEYGDDYDDIRELASSAGLTYAPGQFKYGDNTLYELGMAQPDVAATPEKEVPEAAWDYGDPNIQRDTDGIPMTSGNNTSPEITKETEDNGESPRHKWGWLRYAGLLGPAVGLGMQALGIGKPDTDAIDAALHGAGDVSTATWKPLGNYLTYRPLDIWYQQNALNAQARATDRAVLNQSSPSRMAGLLASGYNSQLASGNLFRQAQEYNDALRKQVEEFNRDTDKWNSDQFGRTSQFNADARNRARQANAQMKLHAAAQKADMDAGWNQGIYGNIAGLFKGLGDIGRENEQFNWLSDLAADGAFGNLGTSNTSRRWTKDKKAKGGKMKKKGLTI